MSLEPTPGTPNLDSTDPRVRAWVTRFGGSMPAGSSAARTLPERHEPEDLLPAPSEAARPVATTATPAPEFIATAATTTEAVCEEATTDPSRQRHVNATSVSITSLRRRAEQRPDARRALTLTAAALVLVGAVGALLTLAPRLAPQPRPATTTRVATPAPATAVDAVPVAMPEATVVPASHSAPTPVLVTPAPAPRTVAPVVPAGPSYTLAVGTFLAEDRARAAADALAAETGRKVTVQDLGAGLWRLHLGRFATAADAEQAANRLLARGAVSEAVLEPLPE